MKTKLLFFVSSIILLINPAFAQKNLALNDFLNKMALEYKIPDHFIESDSTQDYWISRDCNIQWTYRLLSKDKKMNIAFSLMDYDKKAEDRAKRFFPNHESNNNYLAWIRNRADTTKYKVDYFPADFTHKTFNADAAGTYTLRQDNKFQNKYNHCKALFIYKKDRGHLELYYFYSDERKCKLKEFIKIASGMLRFK